MSIKKKLLLGFGVVLIVTVVAFISNYIALQTVTQSYKNLAELEVKKLRLAQEIQFEDLVLSNSVRGIIINPSNTEELQRYDQAAIQIENKIDEVLPLLKNERAIEIFDNLTLYNDQLVSLETEMIQLSSRDPEQTIAIYDGEYAEVREIFSSSLEEFKQIQMGIMNTQVEKDVSMIQTRSLTGIVSLVLAIAIGVFIAIFISNKTTKPIIEVTEKLKELSSNEGDLTVRLNVSSQDEIGQLSGAFNEMISTIQSLIREVSQTSDEVASSAEQLSASSEQNSLATQQISESILDISTKSEKQGQLTEENSTVMNELASGIQRIAHSAARVSESAQETTTETLNGNTAIKSSVEQMNTIQQVVKKAEEQTKALDSLTDEIGQISIVITGIADQTNLLALNAAIEAARAGESGKGFAVVADEVRKLAEESRKSASQITQLIERIQINTSETVEFMVEGTTEVENGIVAVNRAGQAFAEISKAIQAVSEQIHEISASSEEIHNGAEQVSGSFKELAHISRETASSSQTVAASSEEQFASIEEISSSSKNLAQMSEKLQLLIGKFKI
ncbi:methyl-accepting chemotaxis protein [Halalkalibacter akibai]|uniref:Chemotaxis protein n=1 Tax=Halalkalibacter akibai (strain ATCC 43226 / DSM 21942 / CIP 109018 / JCM 9157 / 1139) TaxID=1236973 RepID=W4QPW4_HALA3|nr:methyl-accepting chemotaxis protein [Halalkalibacter akibai]GAE33703.1 hypothetical protein JCM9157_724 [Halalkalibacter akibai JCM 9157]